MHPKLDPFRRCVPVTSWPAIDHQRWTRATGPADIFDPGPGVARRWAATSRRQIENAYGRWLTWLDLQGLLDPASAPGGRLTIDRARDYSTDLQASGNAPYTVAARLQGLFDAMRVLEPSGDWAWVIRAAGRIRARGRPIKEVRRRLQPPEEVIALGVRLMDEADSGLFPTLDDARLFRDGLAIASLVYRPERITPFASMEIGRQLLRIDGGWRVAFEADEMKNRRPRSLGEWPADLVPALQRYLDVFRPMLLAGQQSQRLWISSGGGESTAIYLASRIARHTKAAFGVAINPHSFRHLAATTVAEDDPDNVAGVPALLGHARLETSEAHYNMALMSRAVSDWQCVLKRARRAPARSV